jgi:hypothetical protein
VIEFGTDFHGTITGDVETGTLTASGYISFRYELNGTVLSYEGVDYEGGIETHTNLGDGRLTPLMDTNEGHEVSCSGNMMVENYQSNDGFEEVMTKEYVRAN